MDNPDLIEKYEDELSQLIQKMRHDIREEVVHFILDQATRGSEMRIVSKGEVSQDKLEQRWQG